MQGDPVPNRYFIAVVLLINTSKSMHVSYVRDPCVPCLRNPFLVGGDEKEVHVVLPYYYISWSLVVLKSKVNIPFYLFRRRWVEARIKCPKDSSSVHEIHCHVAAGTTVSYLLYFTFFCLTEHLMIH